MSACKFNAKYQLCVFGLPCTNAREVSVTEVELAARGMPGRRFCTFLAMSRKRNSIVTGDLRQMSWPVVQCLMAPVSAGGSPADAPLPSFVYRPEGLSRDGANPDGLCASGHAALHAVAIC